MQKLADLTYPKLKQDVYDKRLSELQALLLKYQIALYQSKQRAVIVLEGMDSAGKGGLIRRLVDNMDSRGYRVYPIGPPTAEEADRHYLQRFWRRIPKSGQLAIFDRSWYGRVLVERVEGYATAEQWQRAYRELNDFERLLADEHVLLIKLCLVIDKDEQRDRLLNRINEPRKRWKLTLADIESRKYWDDYVVAFEDMLEKTSTQCAPWKVIAANNKKYARIEALESIVAAMSQVVNIKNVELMDPELERQARELLG